MNKELIKSSPQALAAVPVGNLSAYVYWVNQIPMLTPEEESDLAIRLHQNNDLEAAKQLVLAHLRFVVRIARGYLGYGLPEADLIQEGNIGLMKAVKRFNPNVGVRLVSFAIHWIRAEIHEFVIKNWRIVKIATTKAQRKLFFNLRKLAKKPGWFSDDEVNTIATELNVSHKEVRQMEQRLSGVDEAFDGYGDEDEASSWSAPAHYLEDKNQNPSGMFEQNDWTAKREDLLHHAIEKLDERSRDILQHRWLNEKKLTLHDLAAKYNVSAERVRQLEQNAMKKLRSQISTLQ